MLRSSGGVPLASNPLFVAWLASCGQQQILGSGIGDSQTADAVINGYNIKATTNNNRGFSNWSFLGWMRALSYGRIVIPPEYIQGVGGQAFDAIVARADDIIKLNPRPNFCTFYSAGNPGASLNQRVLMAGMIKKFAEAGILLVYITQQSLGGAPSAQTRATAFEFSRWLRSMQGGDPAARAAYGLGPQHNFMICDPTRYITDYSSTDGRVLPNFTADGLHFGTPMGFVMGQLLAKQLVTYFNITTEPEVSDINDVYSGGTPGAVNVAYYGNLISGATGVMNGTAGTFQADVFTGATYTGAKVLASGLSYRRYSGDNTAALTFDKVARNDGRGGTRQSITWAISGAAKSYATDMYAFSAQIPSGSVLAGDYVKAQCEVEVAAGSVLLSAELSIDTGNGSPIDGKQSGPLMYVPAGGTGRYLLETPPGYCASAGAKSVNFNIYVNNAGNNPSGQLFIDNLVARKCNVLN